MTGLLIETADFDKFSPVSSTRFLWDITCGIFTPLERYSGLFPGISVHSPRLGKIPYSHLFNLIKDRAYNPGGNIDFIFNAQYIPAGEPPHKINTLYITAEGRFISLFAQDIGQSEIESIENNETGGLISRFRVAELKTGIFNRGITDMIKNNSRAIELDSAAALGNPNYASVEKNIIIDKTARVREFVSINAETGPVIIGGGAVIRPFSIIDGPAFIGRNSLVDSARIRGGTTIKDVCRIGGEVECSIVESYSNKHHEGFLGHSYVGEWVNIGALATTSDLKNNYGIIRINNGSGVINTGMNKLGSIIGDYSKIGIGIMLNTGSVVSEGCNLFQEGLKIPSFLPPFSWGLSGKKYRIDRFIEDTEKVMERRNLKLSGDKAEFLKSLYRFRLNLDSDGAAETA